MNSAAVRLLGWSADEAIGRPLHDLVHHSYANGHPYPRDASPIEAALDDGRELSGDVEVFWRKDGAAVGVRYTIRPLDEEESGGAILLFKPLVARSLAEEALRLGEQLYRSLARNLDKSGVLLFDHDLRLLVAEGETLAQPDLDYEALSGHKLDDVLPPDAWERLQRPARAALRGERHELDYVSEDGARVYRVTLGPVRDDQGAVQAGLAVAEDVTQTRHRTEHLHRLAHHDELTGLTNRAAFHELADKALRRAGRAGSRAALLFVDLDGLKRVNDSLGHEAGDDLLRSVAARLVRTVRDVDTIARLGGDEFAVLLDGVRDEAEVGRAADRILRAVTEPGPSDRGSEAEVTASIGIAIQSAADESGAQLLRAADAAMYRAKGLGGNRFQFFDAATDMRVSARLETDRALAAALDRGELEVHYQPEVDLATGEAVAVEALVRWNHPQRGLLGPDEFIAPAERRGLMEAIDGWVMREAASQGVAWSEQGLPPFRIAVNVSAASLRRADFEDTLRRRLRETRLPLGRLELGVSQRVLEVDQIPGETMLRNLQANGTRITVDHFGTGHSPLRRLGSFPVDALKVDRDLMPDIPREASMAVGVLAFAHSLDLQVVAQGVETEEQLAFLRAKGCDRAQGRLICHPLGAEELTAWLISNRRQLESV